MALVGFKSFPPITPLSSSIRSRCARAASGLRSRQRRHASRLHSIQRPSAVLRSLKRVWPALRGLKWPWRQDVEGQKVGSL